MACETQYIVTDWDGGSIPVPCGRCPHCKRRRINDWVFRLQEEEKNAISARFVTLTYAPEYLPLAKSKLPTLYKKDLQNYFKRLRKKEKHVKQTAHPIKYYACGEYGETTYRPHYHCILFNLAPEMLFDGVLSEIWKLVHVRVDPCNIKTIQYTSKYVMKSDKKPEGVEPEFSLMSRKPALGAGIVPRIKKALASEAGQIARRNMGDDFTTIRSEQKKYPIGRTLKQKVQDVLNTSPEQRRENCRRRVEEQFAKDLTVGHTETERRRKVAIAISKAKARQTKSYQQRRLL